MNKYPDIDLADGEVYAGILLGKNGAPDHHLIVLPGDERATWDEAMTWAASIGGELPTRPEQSLEKANASEAFEDAWYWSSEQHAADADYAWGQSFGYGYQDITHKDLKLRARAVRRVLILPASFS